MRFVFPLLAALALAGCQTDGVVVTTRQLVVVEPPASLYNCPQIKKFPEFSTLTDLQVARLVDQLQRSNVTCGNSLAAIKKYVAAAKKAVATSSKRK